MLEGKITKVAILQDKETNGTVLLGVAEYFNRKVNFKVPYNWEDLDYEWFTKELREVLARDLDITVKQMDLSEGRLLAKMKEYAMWNKDSCKDLKG